MELELAVKEKLSKVIESDETVLIPLTEAVGRVVARDLTASKSKAAERNM